MGFLKQDRGGFAAARKGIAALTGLALAAFLAGCGAENENMSARSAVDEESQVAGSQSLEAYPPGQGPEQVQTEAAATDDVAIGVDTSQYADTDPSALTDFRQPLEPYGTWTDDATYGTVWVPSTTVVGADFVPYSTAGHWTYDGSWIWVSDYEWGWAPFHYGRWVLIPGRGWAWIPGRVYSGAWVTWSYGPTYVGWAPLAPSWYWYDGYPVGVHVWLGPHYVYCAHRDVFAPNVSTVVVHGAAASAAAASTRPYVPAQPSVGGPSRIPASPTVNGGEAGHRVAAVPTVGPTPNELGHPLASVPKPPTSGNLVKAKAFATPSDAVRSGGRAPASGYGFVGGPGAPRYAPSERDAVAGRASGGPSNVARAAGPNAPTAGARSAYESSRTYGSAPISRPTQTLGGPVYAPRAPVSPNEPVIRSPYSQTAPVYRAPVPSSPSAPVYRPNPTPSMPSAPSAPVYRSSPSMPSAPVYRPSAPSAPVYRPAPTPSMPSAPVYRPSAPMAPPPAVHSAPVVRPSTPAPAARPSRGAVRR